MKWLTVVETIPLYLLTISVCLVSTNKLSAADIDEGCFQLSNTTKIDSPPGNYKLSELTSHKCVVMCAAGHSKLASLTNREVCLCSSTLAGSSSSCDRNCTGDTSLNCGGLTSFRAYNLSTLLRNQPTLQFSSTPKFLQETQYQVKPNETTNYDVYHYQLTHKSTGFLNEKNTNLNFSNNYPYTFTAWGSDVEVTVIVVGNVRQEFQKTVEVNASLTIADIKCPTYVTVGFPIECTGRLDLGKKVILTWRSGGLFGSMNLPDPVSWYIGDPVPRWDISDPGVVPANGLVISLLTGVTHSVIVYAWEMSANKSGTIDIMVLRPSCGIGEAYCPTTKSCCEVNHVFSSELCNEESSFCGTTSMGTSSNNCTSSDINNPVPLFSTYKNIYNATFVVKVGYNLKILTSNDRFEYLPGDIVGWIKTATSATLAVDLSHGEFSVLETVTSLPTNDITLTNPQQNSKQVGTILIAGVASKPNEFLVNINSTRTPGEKNVSIKLNQTNEGSLTTIRSVIALNPIGNVSFTSASNSCTIYGPLRETFNVSVEIESGTNAQITWKVNGISVESPPYLTLSNSNLENITRKQNFTFSYLGKYPLIVLVANGVSGKLLNANIVIQEKIIGLKAAKMDNKTVYQGFRTRLNASISKGTNVTYKWYFGDGSDIITTANATIEHVYHKFGMINTTVEATNMLSSLNDSIMIKVVSPVEITIPPYGKSNVSTNVTCELAKNLLDSYVIVVQIDNTSYVSTNCNTIYHVFTAGDHDIYCYIQVGVVLLSSKTSLYVLEPITGLSISEIPPLALNATYEVKTNITAGNNVSYSWQVPALGNWRDVSLVSSKNITFTKIGHIKLTVNASNAVSMIYAEKIITVQERIGKLNINSSSNPAKTNSVIKFDINPTAGSEVKYTVNSSTNPFQNLSFSASFNYTFSKEGIYIIHIFASNLISSSNTIYTIAVQEPVVRRPQITCPSVSLKDDTCVVPTNTEKLFTAKIPYATNTMFVWMWGDAGDQTDASPSETSNITSVQKKTFPDVGRYNISVIAKNDVSYLSNWLYVETLHNVMNFSFEVPKAVAVNKTFDVNANISVGSNVTYSFHDGVTRNESWSIGVVTASWNYTEIGVYLITGKASNLVSSGHYSKYLTIQKEITRVELSNISTVQTGDSTNISWKVIGGTNVTSKVSFGDDNSRVLKYTECQFIGSTSSYNCATSYTWDKPGTYEVKIQANNLLETKKKASIRVIVQDPISIFNVTVNPTADKSYFVHKEIIFNFTSKGSGVKYQIFFNDTDSRTENTSESTFAIKYYTARKYKPYFIAYNDISSKKYADLPEIEVKIPPNPVKITNLKISAKPVKLNDSTNFEVTYEEGALFECSVNFGDGKPNKKYSEVDINKGVSHTYEKCGKFVVKLECWNTKDSKNLVTVKEDVFVQIPIDGFKLGFKSVTVIYMAEIDIKFSWINGTAMTVIAFEKDKQNVSAKLNDENYKNHSGVITMPSNYFPKPGIHVIQVKASNLLSSKEEELTVHVVEEIKGANLLFNPYVSVSYRLRAYLSFDKGSDLKVTWDFGDGSLENITYCGWKISCFHDHTYNETGKYNITAKAENDKSKGHASGTVKIENPILSWKFAQVNVSKERTPSIVELKKNHSSFPFPSNATYLITFNITDKKNGKIEKNLTTDSVRENYTYTKAGCNKVTVKMKNKVSTVVMETEVKVRGDYGSPEITAESLKTGHNKSKSTFPFEYPVKFFSNINNDCLQINWTISNGSQIIYSNSRKRFEHKFKDPGKYYINFTAYDNKDTITTRKVIKVDKSVTGLYFSSDGIGEVNKTVQFILLWATLGNSTEFTVDFDDGNNKEILALQKKTKDFGDQSKKLPFDPTGLEGILFNHNFSEIRTYTIKVTDKDSEQELTNQVDISKAPCPLPVITVVGGNKKTEHAPKIPYGIEYTLFSKVEGKECSEELKIDFQWSIFKADEHLLEVTKSSVIPPDEDLKVDLKDVTTDQSTLVIPRKKLEPGLKIFQLSATFEGVKAKSQNIVYVNITKPPLIVEIKGGSARSIPWNKKFELDATGSHDPLPRENKLSFKWQCKLKNQQEKGGCFGSGEELSEFNDDKKPSFRKKLLFESFTYQFTVTVADGERSGNYTQEINAIPGKPAQMELSCVSNCFAKINPSERWSITSKCHDNCEGLKYNWTLADATCSQTSNDIWPNRTLTKKTSASLVVKAGTFETNQVYIFKLEVNNDHDKTAFVSYEVETNSPPYGGTCDFAPRSGSSKDYFDFTCKGWKDDANKQNEILWYKVFYSYGKKNDQQNLLYHGPRSTVPELRLPAAFPENNHMLNLSIHVEDAFKAYNSTRFTIKVVPAVYTLKELENATGIFRQLLRSGDLQAANQLAITLMAELCSPGNGSKKENAERANLCNSIVKDISTPENFPKNLDSIRQSLGTVIAAVSLQDNVSESTQNETLSVCHKTANKLESEAGEDLGNDVIEDIAKAVTSGLGEMFDASAHTQANNRENNVSVSTEETENIDNNNEKGFDSLNAVEGAILKKKVPDEQGVLLDTPKLKVSLRRTSAESMNGSSVAFSDDDKAKIDLPRDFDVKSLGGGDVVDVVGLHMDNNPYQMSNTSSFVDSSSVSLELKHKNGTLLKVQDLANLLAIMVPRKGSENDSIPVNKTESKLKELVVHVLVLNSQNNAFVVEIDRDESNKSITIYGRRDGPPTFEKYDFNHTFEINSTRNQYFLGNETINGVKYYVGVASQDQGEIVQINYTLKSYEIGCYFYDEEEKVWSTDGCTPSSNSTKKLVHCLCNHATLFGSNFFVAPNKLDVGAQIQNLANLLDYPALVATICVIGGFYLIGMIWALRNDRKKHCKTTLHCAADNEPYDSHRYEVTLFTGTRRNAGSTAEMSIIITGDDGDSEPRLLQRTSSVSFKRTSQDSYLVTTAYSLGSLQYIRIWHDNSGSDPSWFLSEVIIRDVETGEQYFFLCNSWLACDEGDGLVERLIPVAGPEELKDFQYLFMQNSTEGFSDGHLWFSIILRPAQSRFTHAQRITCCLCLLLCTMLVNAMFFKVPVDAENNVDVDVGPYSFTWHEVMVGIQSSFIVFPINLLIVTIFRRIAARPTKSSKYLSSGNSSGKHKKASGIAISLGDIEMEKNKKKAQKKNQQDEIPVVETHTPGKKVRLLPWWFVFIAWFLVISVTMTAGFFTLLYGLQFGKRRQEQWLTALVISVFQDILVSQPIKIFALSLFVAFVIKKPNNIGVNEENDKLIQDEEWVQDSLNKANADGIVRTKSERKPPDELILRKMRLFREKERKMFGVFREVLQFFFFWWIVLMIAYGYREPDAHLLSTSIEKTFVDLGGENNNFAFQSGKMKHDIYLTRNKRELLMWLREIILPGLYHDKWYNNMTDSRDHIISDGVGYLVGSPRLRLLRIKKDTCSVAKEFEGIFDGCESEYSFTDEYQEMHNSENWVPFNGSFKETDENSKWQYKTQSELYERPFIADLATYRGGGYVLKLSKKKHEAMQQLEGLNETWWVDGQTRAVFVEFTMFYPGKNLHCIVTILFECPASGGCSTSFQIQATRLDEFIGNYRIFVLACELVFIISIAIFTYKTCKDIVKQGSRFWYQFWNWIEMSIIAVGWTCLAFYILRFIANKWTKSKFHDNKGNFVSFRYVATADQLYGIVLAFLVFLTSIKFLRLFRFNRRMSLLGSTLKFAAWDMFNFLVLFAVPFIACASVAYLLFQTNIDMFSSLLSTMETLLNIILGKFKYMNLSHDTFVASAVVLAVYCIVVVFVLMNVFLVILNDAFKVVKSNNDLQENEHEIVDYMSSRVKSWLGFRTKPSQTKSDFEHEYGFKPTYVAPVKKKYQVPATAVLDRKLQELLDFVEKQARRDDMENTRIDEFEDETTKKKALLLLMS